MRIDAGEAQILERRGGKGLPYARGRRVGIDRAGPYFVEHATQVGFSHAKRGRNRSRVKRTLSCICAKRGYYNQSISRPQPA